MFDILGVAVSFYALVAAATGQVWARSGPGARLVRRGDSPRDFWGVITIYAGLGFAMLFLF